MTREELRDYVEEQRNLDVIPYHVYSTLIDGIDTLEQESVLDKVKAEVESMDFDFGDYYDHTDEIKEMVCKVIDKYKAESEEV